MLAVRHAHQEFVHVSLAKPVVGFARVRDVLSLLISKLVGRTHALCYQMEELCVGGVTLRGNLAMVSLIPA